MKALIFTVVVHDREGIFVPSPNEIMRELHSRLISHIIGIQRLTSRSTSLGALSGEIRSMIDFKMEVVMPHPLKLVERIQDTQQLARLLYETRFENTDPKGYDGLPASTQEAYLEDARRIIERLGGSPVPLRIRRTEAFATRNEVRMTYVRAFMTGVEYAMPKGNMEAELKEQVVEAANKGADEWLKKVERA